MSKKIDKHINTVVEDFTNYYISINPDATDFELDMLKDFLKKYLSIKQTKEVDFKDELINQFLEQYADEISMNSI